MMETQDAMVNCLMVGKDIGNTVSDLRPAAAEAGQPVAEQPPHPGRVSLLFLGQKMEGAVGGSGKKLQNCSIP